MDIFFSKLVGANEQVRQPRFAGTWYSSETKILDSDLSRYLKIAKEQINKPAVGSESARKQNLSRTNILAIISPHAGYLFSGQTAAFTFQSLHPNKYKRVFLLGPSHHIAFKGIAVPSQNAFVTPLGDLQVDERVMQKFLKQPYFQTSDAVFDSEHSLEMQLPWIRKTLGNIKLIPLAVGIVGDQEIAHISDAIKNELTDGDLIVISSDFTHYGPRFDYQPFGNEQVSDSLRTKIKTLDFRALSCLKSLDAQTLLEFYEQTRDTICGIYPCAILLSLLPANTNISLLNYATSQDVQKDLEGNSVSYMAIVCAGSDNKGWSEIKKVKQAKRQDRLTEAEGKTLLKIARTALKDYLQGEKRDPINYVEFLKTKDRARLMEKRGVFVTLYKKTDVLTKANEQEHHKELRGCIGYISPNKPLLLAVCENVINAACHDPRFKPVILSEWDQLIIEISALTVPKPISNWQGIKLGQDGIVLHKGRRQSVFLPKVATEFGWDLPQTLSQLSLKAGLSISDWQQDTQFEIFHSQAFSE